VDDDGGDERPLGLTDRQAGLPHISKTIATQMTLAIKVNFICGQD
jgi:hypothetical protein